MSAPSSKSVDLNSFQLLSISQICLLCGENETQEGTQKHKVCDQCYENAGDYLEQNVEMLALIPDLIDVCTQACDWFSDPKDETEDAMFSLTASVLNKVSDAREQLRKEDRWFK